MILEVGSAEPLDSTKQCQGLRKATFVKNSAVNSEHSRQSWRIYPKIECPRAVDHQKNKKGFNDFNFVK